MDRTKYLTHLKAKGYTVVNENRVTLGSLVFDVQEHTQNTAMGTQRTFCLKLSPESQTSLCPPAWSFGEV